MPIPQSVRHADLMAALEPLCDLVGTNPLAIFANPGILISQDQIQFTVASSPQVPHPQGVESPAVVVGEGHSAEYGYQIAIAVEQGERVAA
jgi:hypothetical protein